MSAPPPVSNSTSPPSPPPLATNATSPPPSTTNGTTPPPSTTNATTPLPPLPSTTINTTLSPPLPGPPEPPEPPKGGLPTAGLVGLIVGIGIGGLIVLIGWGIFVICYRGKNQRRQDGDGGPSPPQPQVPKTKNEHWQQNSLPPKDDKVTLFPKPTPPPGDVHSLEMVQVTTPPASSFTTSSMDSDKPLPPPSPGYTAGLSQGTFSSEELATATNGFSNTNLLGQGGFGYVHKGVLPNGKVVAVKQLKAGSGQGEREFRAEVEVEVKEKGNGVPEVGPDDVVVGGEAEERGSDVVVVGGGVGVRDGGGKACVEGLQGLKIGEKVKNGGNGDKEGEKKPTLTEGFV